MFLDLNMKQNITSASFEAKGIEGGMGVNRCHIYDTSSLWHSE